MLSTTLRTWLVSILGLGVFLVISYVVLIYGMPLVLPFVMALIFAQMIEPIIGLVTWKGKVSRTLAVSLVLLLFVVLISTAVTVAVGRLVQEVQRLYAQVPDLYLIGLELSARFSEQFGAFHDSLPASIQDVLHKNLTALQDTATKSMPSVTQTLGLFGGLPVFLANLVVALIATFFISRDRDEIGDFLISLFPAEWRPQIREVKLRVWTSAMGFLKAQAVLILLTMVQSMIGLAMIGSEYAVSMGIVIGLADVMPLLGPGAIYLPWAVYHLLFGVPTFGVKLLVLYGIVTGIRQVLEAKVIGEQMGLHPLAILLSIYLGFQFFGALGLIVGPLLAILLKAMIQSGLLPIFQDMRRK